MTATSSVDRMDQLITIFSHRLAPLTLQRLSITEILNDGLGILRLDRIPTKDDLGITDGQQEATYSRLIKFLQLHEPTGTEKDEANKRAAIRYTGLIAMLQECKDARLKPAQDACVAKMLRWFEETMVGPQTSTSASTPALPPRMSPKRPVSSSSPMSKSASQGGISSSTVTNPIAQKLDKYKMPNVRASHIKRVAALRSRGIDTEEMPPEPVVEGTSADIQKPEDAERLAKDVRIKETFSIYEPETEAEREMYEMWLRRREEEQAVQQKEEEVRHRLKTWTINKSREESEMLRRHESTKLAAGLEQFCVQEYDAAVSIAKRRGSEDKGMENIIVDGKSNTTRSSFSSERPSSSAATRTGSNGSSDSRKHSAVAQPPPATPNSTDPRDQGLVRQSSNPLLVVKKKKPISSSGGMHFRNQLPSNFAPQNSKRGIDNKSSSSSSSNGSEKRMRPLNRSDSKSSVGSGTSDESASSSGVPKPLIAAANQDLADAGGLESINSKDRDYELEIDEHYRVLTYSGRAPFETNQELKFQPFHVPYYAEKTTRPASAAATNTMRKMHPRGTIPPQPLPADPEFRILHEASVHRKPPLPDPAARRGSFTRQGSNQTGINNPTRPRTTLEPPLAQSMSTTSIDGPKTGATQKPTQTRLPLTQQQLIGKSLQPQPPSMSEFRASQQAELNKIRMLFEQHQLPFMDEVFERALIVPDDRQTTQCIQNLPLAGSRLPHNPLLRVRVKSASTKKKTKKKGKGTKKKKKNGSAGSPKKKASKKKKT